MWQCALGEAGGGLPEDSFPWSMTLKGGMSSLSADLRTLRIESPEVSGTATASISAFCLQLGWSMQRLYRARPERERAPSQLPDRLPGLTGLTRLRRVEIDYGTAKTCLDGIASALSQTGLQVPDISDIGTRLDGFKPSTDPTASISDGELLKKYKAPR